MNKTPYTLEPRDHVVFFSVDDEKFEAQMTRNQAFNLAAVLGRDSIDLMVLAPSTGADVTRECANDAAREIIENERLDVCHRLTLLDRHEFIQAHASPAVLAEMHCKIQAQEPDGFVPGEAA